MLDSHAANTYPRGAASPDAGGSVDVRSSSDENRRGARHIQPGISPSVVGIGASHQKLDGFVIQSSRCSINGGQLAGAIRNTSRQLIRHDGG
ncbi:MAG: hypothetical protein H0W76_03805 [Pyrinomonadaceae bacterium]|nr:hypothetical protein [Pyrinomonadaceae bacterium]